MIKTEFGNDLKNKLSNGIIKLNASVSSTLGPSGRNVLIKNEDGTVRITKDGVTVAKAFTRLEDPVEDVGAQLIKQVSIKSADKAGDGTTTSTLLATTMVLEGIKGIGRGSNPVEVKKGIDKAVAQVVKHLKTISTDITSEDQIKQVATISANNDSEVGNLIATALDKVGRDGVVAIEESKTGETSLEIVEGMEFERGYKSPYFVTDNNTMQSVLDKPYVLLFDGRLTTSKQLLEVLNFAATQAKPLLIIAEDIDGEALATLLVNKMRGNIQVCAVKAPDFGERRTHILEDIATLTNATVISKDKGHTIEKIPASTFATLLGKCRVVTSSKDKTTIIDGTGKAEEIEARVLALKEQIDNSKSDYERERLQDRLAKLIGGVAIINVGGLSEIELKEKKDRVDDALHATKAAIEEGIVPGGGMAFIECANNLDRSQFANNDQLLGYEIVLKAIKEPFRKILYNAGIDDPHSILADIKAIKETYKEGATQSIWEGFNVKNMKYENFLTTGILDPTKITRTAIENAASVAGTIITTESVIYDVVKDKDEKKQSMGDFDMG